MDVFVLLGPSPHDVFRQYAALTGPSTLPPVSVLVKLGMIAADWRVSMSFLTYRFPWSFCWSFRLYCFVCSCHVFCCFVSCFFYNCPPLSSFMLLSSSPLISSCYSLLWHPLFWSAESRTRFSWFMSLLPAVSSCFLASLFSSYNALHRRVLPFVLFYRLNVLNVSFQAFQLYDPKLCANQNSLLCSSVLYIHSYFPLLITNAVGTTTIRRTYLGKGSKNNLGQRSRQKFLLDGFWFEYHLFGEFSAK